MHLSKKKRLKRAKATRRKIRELGISRLTVTRTPRHIYAQVTSAEGDKVLAQASSLDKEIRMKTKVMPRMLRTLEASLHEKQLN